MADRSGGLRLEREVRTDKKNSGTEHENSGHSGMARLAQRARKAEESRQEARETEKAKRSVTSPANWVFWDQMFQEEEMFQRMMDYAREHKLPEFEKALNYARALHSGVNRKPDRFHMDQEVPYIVHPLMMASHACVLGICDDQVLATIMLHDVCEDCDVLPEDLPFSAPVRHSVALLTKEKKDGGDTTSTNTQAAQDAAHSNPPHAAQSNAQYYAGIRTDACASIVKALDRCNNVSTMASSFSGKKIIEYIQETEEYVYPLLDYIQSHYPQYHDPVFAIKYQLFSLIATMKALIVRTRN